MTTTTSLITDIRTVGVPVSDQDRSLTFYTGALGFRTRLDAPMSVTMRWIEVAPPNSSTLIALIAADARQPDSSGIARLSVRSTAHG